MRSEIRWLINAAEIRENEAIRLKAMEYNLHNQYSMVEVPERVQPIYENTHYSFKISNVVDYIVEPTKDRDMIVNLAGRGEQRLKYDPILEDKLELLFHGE